MDEKDVELFLEMLSKLDGSHESIKAASKWCRANAQHHKEIVKMWFFTVAKARSMTRRLDLFHLASDILFTVDATSDQYYASFLPELVRAVPFARSEHIRLSMQKLFALWRSKNIYNKVVMDRLEKHLRNNNKVIDMRIFRYDKDLLFKNLHRIKALTPACNHLMKHLQSSPSFDNSAALLEKIKERKSGQELLDAVDEHKNRMTSLVENMEEMVHLLKMSTAALDIAANREQNGIEESHLKMSAYNRYTEKILSILHRLESNYNIKQKEPESQQTPAPETSLFSRRSTVHAEPARTNWQSPNKSEGYIKDGEMFHRRRSSYPSAPTNARSWTPSSSTYSGSSSPYAGSSSASYGGSSSPYVGSSSASYEGSSSPYVGSPRNSYGSTGYPPYQQYRGFQVPPQPPYSRPSNPMQSPQNYPGTSNSLYPSMANLAIAGPSNPAYGASSRSASPAYSGSASPAYSGSASPAYSGSASPWGNMSSYGQQTPIYQPWYTGIPPGPHQSLQKTQSTPLLSTPPQLMTNLSFMKPAGYE